MKYKLIKNYPGSPDLGFITSPRSTGHYYVSSNWLQPEKYPEFWEKVVEPVFTTHDNIDIYGNEKLFIVTKCLTLGVGLNFNISDLKDSDYIFFAKKENAEEYIKANKPKRMYTEEEMVRALENWGMCKVDIRYVNKFLNK